MEPELEPGTVAVIDAGKVVCPGDTVLAFLSEKNLMVLRKYAEAEDSCYQLFANNSLWAATHVKKEDKVMLLGVLVEHRHYKK